MRIPPVRVCRTKVSNNFTTSNPMNEYLQWRLNETLKTINEVTVHLIRDTKREKSRVIHSILHLSTKITHSTIQLVSTTRCEKLWSYDHRFARPTIYDQRLYTSAAVSGDNQRGNCGGTWPSRRRRRGAHLRRGPAHLVSRPSCRPSSPPSANTLRRLPRELSASRTQSPLGDPNTKPARPRCFPTGWPCFGIVRHALEFTRFMFLLH